VDPGDDACDEVVQKYGLNGWERTVTTHTVVDSVREKRVTTYRMVNGQWVVVNVAISRINLLVQPVPTGFSTMKEYVLSVMASQSATKPMTLDAGPANDRLEKAQDVPLPRRKLRLGEAENRVGTGNPTCREEEADHDQD